MRSASWPSNRPVSGAWPMAMKTPLAATSLAVPSRLSRRRAPVTPDASPSTSSSS
ncbi:Uncharacterised protein [Bordetella pertussis]|nr:Uncharacterised protein [Bordetella pertussis]